MIRKFIIRIVQSEIEDKASKNKAQLQELKKLTEDNKRHLDTLEFLLKMYQGKLHKENERRQEVLADYEKSLELQKLHCYIIPRLLNSSGLELREDFDITKYEDALELYNRFRSGDLSNL